MGFFHECRAVWLGRALLASAFSVVATAGASATSDLCTQEKQTILADMAAHGALNCVNQQGVGNLVQSMRFSGGKIVSTLRGTTKSGSPFVITSSADLRDFGSVGMNGAKERCGTSENLLMQCKSGACVSVVDSSHPSATPGRSYLFEFAVGDREASHRIYSAFEGIVGGTCRALSGPTMTIRMHGGAPVTVADFVHDPHTITDFVNRGRSLLSGALGYCLPDGRCGTADDTGSFDLFYSPEDNQFDIELKKVPLEKTREDATRALMSRLQIGPDIACQLKSHVSVKPGLDARFADNTNLGLSFCSNAKPLQ